MGFKRELGSRMLKAHPEIEQVILISSKLTRSTRNSITGKAPVDHL
jgi:hypothetical protein